MKKINNENFRLSPSIADIESPEFGADNRGAFPYYSADELPPVNKKKKKRRTTFNLVLGFKEFLQNKENYQ